MPVIGGANPTVNVTLPVPTPMAKKPKAPAPAQPAPQPVPTNPDSGQQPAPQGLVPQQQTMPAPTPTSIIFPWTPADQPKRKLPRKSLRMAKRKYNREALQKAVEENPGDPTPRNMLADFLEGEDEYGNTNQVDALRSAPNSLEIHGRRWRDRNGNSYHTSDIIVDGNHVATVPAQYGYGDHFLWTAMDHMEKNGIIKGRKRTPARYGEIVEGPRAWAQRHGVNFDYTVTDVPRKRDLSRKYAAGDDFSMDFDSMGEDELPRQPLQRPVAEEDITGRKRKQILQQMLEAAKKGHYSELTPTEMVRDLETPPDVPQFGGQVWLSDPEDEGGEPKQYTRLIYPNPEA